MREIIVVGGGAAGMMAAVSAASVSPEVGVTLLERLNALYRRFASVLLCLNCYDDMAVTFDGCEHWEINPDPESFADRLAALPKTAFFRAVFEERKTMIDLDSGDTNMTAFDPDGAFLDRLTKLAASEGLFVWKPPEG